MRLFQKVIWRKLISFDHICKMNNDSVQIEKVDLIKTGLMTLSSEVGKST